IRAWWARIAGFLRPGAGEREFADELQSHIDLHTDDNIRAGMTPDEARRQALLQVGSVTATRDAHRDRRGLPGLEAFLFDLKLGGRMLVKYPGLTIVGGVAMAFAIGLGLVIFQVVSLFTHPTLPLPQGARLVEVGVLDVSANDEEKQILYDLLEWQQSLRSLTEIGAWRDSSRNLIVNEGEMAPPVIVAEMSVQGFRVSDGVPLMGRVLAEADEHLAAPAVAVIGHEVWRTRFGSDPNVLGRTVQLGNDHVTVVGVMREGFEFPVAHDVWVPFKTSALDQAPRSGPAITAFALLAPGETITTAQAELTTAGRRTAAGSPETHQHLQPRVRPYAMLTAPGEPDEMMIMSSIYFVIVLLLILNCSNVGLLLFARAASREADLLVRSALGASRARIVTQMFAEALVLGGVAALVGVTAAGWTLRTWGVSFLETNMGRLPFWFDLSLSPRAFAVAILLTVGGAAVAGIVPALKITRGMGQRLKQTTAGGGGLQFGGVWTVVIVAQVAATVMFPALVYLEQALLRGIKDFDPGFAAEQYLAVQIERDEPVDGGASSGAVTVERNARLAATLEALRRRVAEQPGVTGVTFVEDLPATNHPKKIIEMDYDRDASGSNADVPLREATIAAVHPSYFEVLEAPILAGRGFTAADAAPGSRVAIVDHGFIEQVLQGRNAVGQQVRFRYPARSLRSWGPGKTDDPVGPGDWYEVIGVVRELGVGAPTQDGRAAGFYVPATPELFDQIFMMVRVRGGDPMAVAPQVRDAAMTVDTSLRLVNLQRLNEANNDVLWVMTLWLRITVVLSAVALILSLAGIFAVLSFTVARRTREIGVRVALGASRRRVVAATFRRPLVQVTLGVIVGTAVVFMGAVLMRNTELPGSVNDLGLEGIAMIVGYGLVMLGVCMLGCVVPTRRALTIEPTVALRTE
ncbi:MAG: ABC transporter permease, partial [Vicinamibacterales bacterium]